MAVLHRKEEKIQAVLGRLSKKYSPDDFVAMFIKLYSKDWGKIKSAYLKASQDKEAGTVIHMPKPELYLKQVLEIFLTQEPSIKVETPKEEEKVVVEIVAKTIKRKTPVKKVEVDTVIKKKIEVDTVIKKRVAPKKKID